MKSRHFIFLFWIVINSQKFPIAYKIINLMFGVYLRRMLDNVQISI